VKWEQLWLNYKANLDYCDQGYFNLVYQLCQSELTNNAVKELAKAAKEMFGISLMVRSDIEDTNDTENAKVTEDTNNTEDTKDTNGKRDMKDIESIEKPGIVLRLGGDTALGEEGVQVQFKGNKLILTACEQKGLLYGAFHIIRQAKQGKPLRELPHINIPSNKYRMLNHWDDFEGKIERGYSGSSFFFKNREVLINERTRDYARLLASMGINQISINNVNVREGASELITKKYFPKVRELAKLLEGYGVKLFLSVNFASPMVIGGLDSADPLEERVISWWQDKVKEIYENVPNFGGFLVKADSEGWPGPFAYHRNHAQGANLLADALAPYGGVVIWRCFVYNCQQDWRDTKTDRAKAAYDNFAPLDGQFASNVILQVKNGPVDFQVREPVSPLFGRMKQTNQMLEVQIAQEYTGQQIDCCYLVPMWKEVLDFRTYCREEGTLADTVDTVAVTAVEAVLDTVADVVSGRVFGHLECGMAAVTNTGDDPNWTGHDLAAANLYGFGRLAWDTSLSSEAIAREWIAMTYHLSKEFEDILVEILMGSWHTYEKYTSPLGIGWMVNASHHYGPNVDAYEYDVWGTYHRANHLAIGVDRTSSGTGMIRQYYQPNAQCYDNIETCPEELLLFFHRVDYNHLLPSGITLLQHIYNTHFEGVEEVKEMIEKWSFMKDAICPVVHERVLERFNRQLENSKNWRDVINTYFYRKTLIPDEKGRQIYE